MNPSEEQDIIPDQVVAENEKDDQQLQPEEPEKPQIVEQSNLDIVAKEEDNLEPSLEDGIIQKRIQKLMKTENLADVTMPGYVIKLIRMKGSLTFDQLLQETSHCFEALRRADGTKYTGDLFKALKGCLSASVFKEEDGGRWTIIEREAIDYEDRTTQKIKSIIAKQEGKFFLKEEGNESQDTNLKHHSGKDKKPNGNIFSMPGDNSEAKKKVRVSSRKRNLRDPEEYQQVFDILKTTCKAYKMDDKTRYLIKSPFENLNVEDPQSRLAQKLGKDKLVGVLQCFDYFFPIIEDYLQLKANGVNSNPTQEIQENNKPETHSVKSNQKVEDINHLNSQNQPEDH